MRCICFLAFMLAFLPSATTEADLILGVRYTDLTISKTVNSGDTVSIELFLTDTDASTPLVAEGLLNGGGRLLRTAGTATLTPGLITGNAGWIDSFSTSPSSAGGPTEIAKALGGTDLLFGPAVPTISNVVVIATFNLVATGPGTSATITSDLLGPGLASNVTFTTFADLDALLVAPANFSSVTLTLNGAAAVPEPATTAFLLATFGAVTLRRRFRRQPALSHRRMP